MTDRAIIQELSQSLPLKAVTLPMSKVQVLDGKILQRILFSTQKGLIQDRQLSLENRPRPAIKYEMRHTDDQPVGTPRSA
jgi:hypothetical protein